MKPATIDNAPSNERPMTRRGPDGRVQETVEMEERARDVQKFDKGKRATLSLPRLLAPD